MKTTVLPTMEKTIKEIIQESLSQVISYGNYREKVTQLALEGKSTGIEQTEALTNYTVLNDKRMKRFDKTVKVDTDTVAKIAGIDRKLTLLVLTESWCGDAAPTMPVMNKIAELNPNITFKVLLRDENLELMHRFLTNGTLSIPKLIAIDDTTMEVIGDWGPRPSIASKMVEAYKKEHGKLTPEFKQDLQVWYNKDKGQDTLKDLWELLEKTLHDREGS